MISVAMATYNGAAFLPQQLASFVAQERRPDELVVTDDRSSDGTAEFVERFAETAPFRVRFSVNPERLGIRDNFQRALSLAEGDIVLLSDQDDAWFPAKIRRLVEHLEQDQNALVVMNDKIIADEQLQPSTATMLSNIRGYGGALSQFVAGCCAAVRRQWLDVVLPIPEGIAYHDVWILGLAHDLGVVRLCDEPLQLYRRHGKNASEGPYNAPRKLTKAHRALAELALLRQKQVGSQKDQWEVERHWAVAKAARLRERRELLAQLGLGDAAAALEARLSRRATLFGERHRLASLNPLSRSIEALKLWRSGGYAEFAGWKSLAKDLTLR